MLQRAASNAYSWWCASHIRTNQSKWLNNDLQEMESRVQAMLKIIEEDADSFARRAEMYYRRRPELINFVEETYRAYRALAERFDHVSGELHKANNTLATAFPDVQFPMEDDDDDNSEAFSSSESNSLKPPPRTPHMSFPKPPPEVPQINLSSKRRENKPSPEEPQSQPKSESSQIGEDKAKETVDKLQKAILVMQTEKEFIKSSYEIGLAKYWEIEKMITEMQEEVCSLQDQFSASTVIEDDEARTLMAATALKSCNDTLLNLQDHQKRSMEQTVLESERIKTAKEKLRDLTGECVQPDEIAISDENMVTSAPSTTTDEEASVLHQETLDLESIYEKVRGHCEISSQTTVFDLAEKIDELVNKLLNLEVTVSSHTAQLQTLRSETDHIQMHLRSLEENKLSFVNRPHSSSDSSKSDEELHKIQSYEKPDKSMHGTDFTEAGQDLGDISEKLQSPNQVENIVSSPFQVDRSLLNTELKNENEGKHTIKIQETNEEDTLHAKTLDNHVQPEPVPQLENGSGRVQPDESEREIENENTPQVKNDNHISTDIMTLHNDQEDGTPNLLQLLSDGMEGKEKILLAEYTTILRSYKETKRKLLEVEKQNQENFGETMSQVRQLKNENAMKDGEIRSLRQILSSLQHSSDSKLQNSEILGGLNSESTAKQDASSGAQDKGSCNSEEDVKPYHVEESQATLVMEEKFRKDIDALLDENLEFWLRFSTSFHQIQRFRSEFQSLQSEIEKLKDNKKREGSKSSSEQTGKSEPSPEDKKLRELKTELQVWVEQNAMLRRELETRFSSLCNIQEEISGVSAASPDGGVQFTPYQAAKFQGEVLNMQQENNKVKDELEAGLDHVKSLQDEVEKTLSNLSKLNEKFELSASKNSHHSRNTAKNFSNKNKGVPLRSFLYGAKPKKPSIFSCMHPIHQRKYSDLNSGMPI